MSRSHRRLRRKLALGASAVVAGALIFFDGRAAWAETLQSSTTHEFEVGPGVTCTIEVSSVHSTEEHRAFSVTHVVRDDPPDWRCLDAEAFMTITYTNVSGAREQASAKGEGGHVDLSVEDVASNYSAEHFVAFRYCRCTSPVYRTTPK
jgi:hypothetical protein